jgi:hypothetical protein
MCPPDQSNENPEEHDAGETSSGNIEAVQGQNRIFGPLSDDELRTGGLDRVVSYIRTERSKDALRKERQRNKQEIGGKRQINLVIPDNDRSRTTMRTAAIAIEDENSHQAVELLLANEYLRPLIVGIAARPELYELIDLIQRPQASANSLNAAKLALSDSSIATLVERVTATARMREAMEIAAADPDLVFLGRNATTQRGLWAWLARLLLRVSRTRRAGGGP